MHSWVLFFYYQTLNFVFVEEQSPIKKTRQTENEEDEEPFEIWKDRILKAAYEALGKIYPAKSWLC